MWSNRCGSKAARVVKERWSWSDQKSVGISHVSSVFSSGLTTDHCSRAPIAADDEEDDRVRQRQAGVQQSMADQRADADDDGRPDDRLVHVRVQLSVREGQLGTLLVHALQ